MCLAFFQLTFMNRSGSRWPPLVFYKITPAEVLVVPDELGYRRRIRLKRAAALSGTTASRIRKRISALPILASAPGDSLVTRKRPEPGYRMSLDFVLHRRAPTNAEAIDRALDRCLACPELAAGDYAATS